MKKILLAGIVVLLAVFLVTCDGLFPDDDDEIVEYTDVEYSKDGSRVTVYLDGVGVPVTRGEKRAMTLDLAKIAYDYLEVIFKSNGTISRASWELGQSAGISGVYRGTTGQSYIYGTTKTDDVALMFVGRKDTKLLLGIGQMAEVNHSATAFSTGTNTGPGGIAWTAGYLPSGMPQTIYATIKPGDSSVTFFLEPIITGLFVDGDTVVAAKDSFDFETGGTAGSWAGRAGHSQKISLGTSPAVQYPLYALPQRKDFTPELAVNPIQYAKYEFKGAAGAFKMQIILNGALKVERRLPRYLDGGLYYAPKGSNFDIKSQLKVRDSYTGTVDAAFVPLIPLEFEVIGYGMFSFFLEVPVYMLDKGKATNSGPAAEIWKIRTGFGSELYSLDDGVDGAGGCVLIGVGNTGADWIDIEWDWLKP